MICCKSSQPFHSKDLYSTLKLLTPKPVTTFLKHIVTHLTKWIRISVAPLHRNSFWIFSNLCYIFLRMTKADKKWVWLLDQVLFNKVSLPSLDKSHLLPKANLGWNFSSLEVKVEEDWNESKSVIWSLLTLHLIQEANKSTSSILPTMIGSLFSELILRLKLLQITTRSI